MTRDDVIRMAREACDMNTEISRGCAKVLNLGLEHIFLNSGPAETANIREPLKVKP